MVEKFFWVGNFFGPEILWVEFFFVFGVGGSFKTSYMFITSFYDVSFNFEGSLGKKEKKCDGRTNKRTNGRSDNVTS